MSTAGQIRLIELIIFHEHKEAIFVENCATKHHIILALPLIVAQFDRG